MSNPTSKPAQSTATVASDLAEAMAVWNRIIAAARREFPDASEERIYQIAKGAMNHALGIGK